MSIFRGRDGRPPKRVDFSGIGEKYEILLEQERIKEKEREIKKVTTELKRYTCRYPLRKLKVKFNPKTSEDYIKLLALVKFLLEKEKRIARRRKEKYLARKGIEKDPFTKHTSDPGTYNGIYAKAYSKSKHK